MERLYFDYNATAPLADGLRERIADWLALDLKNPVSAHGDGRKAREAVESSRKTLLNALGAAPKDKLVFTSGGSESNNSVLHAAFCQRGRRNKLLLTPVEHSCIYNYATYLRDVHGVQLDFIPVTADGQIDLAEYERKITPDVFLATTMLANNETGFLFPVSEMAKLARAKGVPFHTDAVCALTKMPVSFSDLSVDYLTFSAHKFGALKGIGGFLVREDAAFRPFVIGGSHEMGWRAGTHNVVGILSAAAAMEVALKHDLNDPVPAKLRLQLKAGLTKLYPNVCFIESEKNLAQTLCAAFPGHSGQVLLSNLDLEGVSVSYGSACASGALEVSRVLRELKVPFDVARSAIRLSFGPSTTAGQIEDLLQRFHQVLSRAA